MEPVGSLSRSLVRIMVKICHLITSLDTGGAELSLLRLLSGIDRERFRCSVIAMIGPGAVAVRIRALDIPVGSLELRRGAVSLSGLARLASRLRQERPHILMTWLYHADLLGLVAGKLAGVRAVVWNLRASDMDMSRYRALSGWTLQLCARLSAWPAAILVNSESGRSFHTGIGYHPREWVLVRNGVDTAEFRPDAAARESVRTELGLQPEALLIGLVARFDPMKDHQNFIAAARKVALAQSSVHFVLVGKGVDSHNAALAVGLNEPPLAGRVHLLGERPDVPRLTAAFDFACSASRSEAFPNVVAEAMACGVVCVATDAGDSAEIVGETGIIVPPRDREALAQGLLRAVSMGPAQRHTLGNAGRERVIEHFGMDRFVKGYENLFDRISS